MITTTLTTIAFLLSSCIHVSSVEDKALVLDTSDKTPKFHYITGGLKVESLIYSPTRLPLNEFFINLRKGQYTSAFKKFDLSYHPSNTDSEILKELIDQGLAPVYVKIVNTTSVPREVSEKDFVLNRGSTQIEAISAEGLPRELKYFNLKAAAANVHNVTVTVVGTFAIFAAIAVSSYGGHYADPQFATWVYPPDMTVINPTTKTVRLSYQDYLFHRQNLAPGESAEGLLFFDNRHGIGTTDLSLNMRSVVR